MTKVILKIAASGLLAAAILGLPLEAVAQTTNKAAAPNNTTEKKSAPEKKEAAPKGQAIPFHGHILELNKAARTIKLDKRVFEINSETKLYKGDKPATLETGIVGEYITGSYKKADDGKLVARSIYFGGKNKEKAKDKPAEKKK